MRDKRHTKKQIEEAIDFWTKKLDMIAESNVTAHVQISSVSKEQWKAQDLDTGASLVSGSVFLNVLETIAKRFQHVDIYANVDGQTVRIYAS